MGEVVLDFRERRATRDAERAAELERIAAEARARGVAEATPELAALIASLPAAQDAAGAKADPEAERRQARRLRLLDAGVEEPEVGSPPRRAWDRVLAAKSAREAALPGHQGSLSAMRHVHQWLGGSKVAVKPILVLAGIAGVGKTSASWLALANGLPGKVPGVVLHGVCVTVGDVAPQPSWNELKERATRTALLVIDDVTEELKPGSWAASEIAGLACRRHDRGLRTLVSTNLLRERLCEVLTDRFRSRLADGVFCGIEGVSMRGGS